MATTPVTPELRLDLVGDVEDLGLDHLGRARAQRDVVRRVNPEGPRNNDTEDALHLAQPLVIPPAG